MEDKIKKILEEYKVYGVKQDLITEELLVLFNVSQQRELLNALADNFNDSTHTYIGQRMIEETLKAFNCG